MLNPGNLVFAVFPESPDYKSVLDRCPDDVKLDLADGTYEAYGKKAKIGSRINLSYKPSLFMTSKRTSGIIGVFDRTDTDHLNAMVWAINNATKPETPEHLYHE